MIDRKHLKIIIAFNPLPEGLKESLTGGLKLFEALQRHGCISENDVELLDEFFVHMRLIEPQKALQLYKDKYPPRHYDPRPSAPLRYPSDPGPAHQPHPTSLFQSQQSYPPPSHVPLSSLSTGFPSGSHTYPSHPVQGGPGQQCQQPPPSQPPSVPPWTAPHGMYPRPGHRDPTFPRQGDPLFAAHPAAGIHLPDEHPIYANLPPANQAAVASTTTPPTGQPTVSKKRGGMENEQFERTSSAEQHYRPPPENPNFASPPRVFNTQVSSNPSLSSAVNTPHSPPTPGEPAVTTPPAKKHHPLLSQPHNPPPSQPSSILPSFRPATTASAASSYSSASSEPMSDPSVFQEPQSCQSTGDPSRSSVSLPSQCKPAGSGPRSPPTTSVGYARESHSLPAVPGDRDKMLGKRSRQMNELNRANQTSKAMHAPSGLTETGEKERVVLPNRSASLGVVSQQPRQVFGKQDFGEGNPSLNMDVNQQYRPPNIQPGTTATQPGSSSAQPRPSSSHPSSQQYSSVSAATQPEDAGSASYRPVFNQSTPIPVHGSSSNSSSEVVPGMSTSPHSAGSRGGSYKFLPNPPNSYNSQYVSQNNSSIGYSSRGSSLASPLGSPNSSYGVYSHDPSTSSLVNRQLFHHQPNAMPSSQGASNSFAPISEDESEDQRERENNQDSYDDSSESEPPSMPPRRKRTRANGAREEGEVAERLETSSSSEQENEEAEEPGSTKRARTEVHVQKKPGIFTRTLQSLPLIGRLYKTEPKEETSASDSESDHFEDAHD